MNGVIYCFTSPSGKKYIGQSINHKRRFSDHKRESSFGQTAFYMAVRKYGFDNFEYSILHSGIDTIEKLNALEIEEIRKANSIVPFGYNLEYGGRSGLKSESTKQKMREKATGKKASLETIEKLRKTHIGKKQTAEAIEKTRKALLGIKRSEEFKAKMRAIRGTAEAREKTRQQSLLRRHTEEAKNKVRVANYKKVINLDTGIVYSSMIEASEKTGIHASYISALCRGVKTSPQKYWSYAN